MTDFERIDMYYDKGWATKTQVAMYVGFSKITHAEYYTITNDKLFLKSEVEAGKLSVVDYEAITGETFVA